MLPRSSSSDKPKNNFTHRHHHQHHPHNTHIPPRHQHREPRPARHYLQTSSGIAERFRSSCASIDEYVFFLCFYFVRLSQLRINKRNAENFFAGRILYTYIYAWQASFGVIVELSLLRLWLCDVTHRKWNGGLGVRGRPNIIHKQSRQGGIWRRG